jgi:hypothetical protein
MKSTLHTIAVRILYALAIIGFVGCGIALTGCASDVEDARECKASCEAAGLRVEDFIPGTFGGWCFCEVSR